ncbi:methyltransferase [Sphingomonas sp. BN140010]|uniref:Methyltransferase n=1 Tax=Sphingomonas arvum TaxID=2992113 RepID=A0ABT3JHG1_9SPHN|nr:methyltransferase [Sphingomonas sp. BN140010]MCW3798493.1 methyltransferase [Sphingomonas sp. BN140010]
MTDTLAELLRTLDAEGYQFTCVTPRTHHRILRRRSGALAEDLRDVFGWNLPFARDLLPGPVLDLLREADALDTVEEGYKSRLRVAELDGRLFLHSAYPTDDEDSVFFGPDTYRFMRFLSCELAEHQPIGSLVDLGAGSGAGGITAAAMLEPSELVLLDINSRALDLAAANATAAGIEAELVNGTLDTLERPVDLIIANPPFIADPAGRTYRDGGADLGAGVSLDWARQGMAKLAEGGAMLLYTGSPIVAGEDRLLSALAEAADEVGCSLSYQELDPDIFGEELDGEPYAGAGVERIAAVGATLRRA